MIVLYAICKYLQKINTKQEANNLLKIIYINIHIYLIETRREKRSTRHSKVGIYVK